MNELQGANCSGLPGFVIDKYFDCNVGTEPLRAMVALAICGNCQVLEACRTQALTAPSLPSRGVLAGLPVQRIADARRWVRYELGLRDSPPPCERPEWLAMSDAAQEIEQLRLEMDPDERGE